MVIERAAECKKYFLSGTLYCVLDILHLLETKQCWQIFQWWEIWISHFLFRKQVCCATCLNMRSSLSLVSFLALFFKMKYRLFPVFQTWWDLCVTGSSPTLCTGCCLKELLICNLGLIKQRNIVCKATLLHELPRIKLFRTDQDHSSHFCFAYFDHVFLPSPLIAFYLIKLALMLCNIYTKQFLKSATLFGIFVRRNCLVLGKA